MEHSHDLVLPVQQEKDFMKEKMSDITTEEWKFIESLIHCAPKVISRILQHHFKHMYCSKLLSRAKEKLQKLAMQTNDMAKIHEEYGD